MRKLYDKIWYLLCEKIVILTLNIFFFKPLHHSRGLKGQLILKCLIGVVNFFQKRRKISQLEDILHNLPATAASTSISRFGGSTSIAVRPPSKVEVGAGALLAFPISRPFN